MDRSPKLFIVISILSLIIITECKNEDKQHLQSENIESTTTRLNAKKPRSLFSSFLSLTSTTATPSTTKPTKPWYYRTTPYRLRQTTYYTKPWYYQTTIDWRHPTTPKYSQPNWQTGGWKTTLKYHYGSTKRWNTTPWYYHTTRNWNTTPYYHYGATKSWNTTPWYYHTTRNWNTTPYYHYGATKSWNTTPWYYHTTRNWNTTPYYHYGSTKRWNTTPWYYHTTRNWNTTPYYHYWSTKRWNTASTTISNQEFQQALSQLLPHAVVPQCISAGWIVVVSLSLLRQAYPGIKASDIYLGEPSCTGSPVGDWLMLSHTYQGCQTLKTVRNNSVVYTNKIIYASYVPGYETRNVQWTVEVECDIEKTVVTTAHIHHDNNNTAPHVTVVGPHVTGVGSYDVRMTFYSDSNFIHKIIGSQLHVPVWSQVYTKVFTASANWDIKMKVDHCYMRTGTGENVDYDLIKNGCPLDPNTHFIMQSTHETRFVFKTFQNKAGEEGFDVRCHVNFCDTSDVTPRCRQTCDTSGVLIG